MTTERAVKALKSSLVSAQLQKKLYAEQSKAREEGKLICWLPVGSGSLGTVVRAMDIVPVFADNYSTVCSAKQLGGQLCEIAEAKGYSTSLCSYFRINMGYLEGGKESLPMPFGGLPDPDILICYRHACFLYCKWWSLLGRRFNKPCYNIDFPFIRSRAEEKDPDYLKYHITRIKECISFLEEHTGRKMDYDRLKENLRGLHKSWQYFLEVQNMRKNIPCPAGAEDIMGQVAPLVLLGGTAETVDYFKGLRDEVKERVENKVGAIPEEKYRIIYSHLPPWYSVGFFNYLHKFDAVCVWEEYPTDFHPQWDVDKFDPEKPLEFLAKQLLYALVPKLGTKDRYNAFFQAVKDYKADGVILVNCLGCRIPGAGMALFADRVREELGIPCTPVLDIDQTDPRGYNDAMIKGRIDAFMEMVEQSKKQ